MPERVDTFPKVVKPNELFDPLTDGSVWKITAADREGRYQTVESAMHSARYFAKRRGLRIKVLREGDDLYVQFTQAVKPPNELAAQRSVRRQQRLAGQA